RSYYAHWGQYVLQEHYGFYPLGELPRLKEKLYETYAKDEMLFIKPDDNDKSFSGRLVPRDNFPQWYEEAQACKPDPAALVVVSAPVRIGGEWRFVIADRKVIAGTYYKWAGKRSPSPDDLRNAGVLAEEIAAESWQPRAIYCVDVARSGTDQFRLVEIGGINSPRPYHCGGLPGFQTMEEIAGRGFWPLEGKPEVARARRKRGSHCLPLAFHFRLSLSTRHPLSFRTAASAPSG